MEPGIIVFGTICLDRIRFVDNLPLKGGYVEFQKEALRLGGEAANTAYALMKWDSPIQFIGNAIGNDTAGASLREILMDLNGNFDDVPRIDGYKTPFCDIYVTPDGARTMFGRHFSDLQNFKFGEIPTAPGAWFTADPNPGETAVSAILEAKAKGLRVLSQDFVGYTEAIKASEIFLTSTVWVGHKDNTNEQKKWASDWANEYDCVTILTDGENGGVFCEPGRTAKAFLAFTPDKIVDTTGSGDSFRAGLLYCLWQNYSIENAIETASGVACLNCMEAGAVGGIRNMIEVEAFIKAQGGLRWNQ